MNKIIKIILNITMIFVCIFLMGCQNQNQNESEILRDYSDETLKTMHTVMLENYYSNRGEVDITTDYWVYEKITVYYDKTIHITEEYNLSGDVLNYETVLSDEDYEMIMDFFHSCEIYKDYEEWELGPDEPSSTYIVYTPEGERWRSFGKGHELEELYAIGRMLDSYVPDYEIPPLYYFEAAIVNYVELSDDTMIGSSYFVDEEELRLRVEIEYKEEKERTYKHKADYFFFFDEEHKMQGYLYVDYPNKENEDDMSEDRYPHNVCAFEAHFEDVTFDGFEDLVISLGCQGKYGTDIHCVYVYKEDGVYEYEKSFEDIPNYSVNMEEGIIEAWVQVDSFEEEWIKYVYEDGEFKETERTRENTLGEVIKW